MQDFSSLFESLGDEAGRSTREQGREGDANLRVTETDPEGNEQQLQWTSELSLMLAILEDAIACYRKTLKRPRQNPDILARQAEFWVRLDDWDSPFSFNNISEALRLETIASRESIFASRAAR